MISLNTKVQGNSNDWLCCFLEGG